MGRSTFCKSNDGKYKLIGFEIMRKNLKNKVLIFQTKVCLKYKIFKKY